ncbi:hypothetical protein GLE_5087 [Lysobacter enzymogenes]|uniref:Uncharacterized protein n=1 Tax=Lysobacter enzymogenes TaxID=69 RepID=A0A0S2DPF0_LYSEN|nr:hypothetical protein GLE_5087 [Lysobacter enzymogenes]
MNFMVVVLVAAGGAPTLTERRTGTAGIDMAGRKAAWAHAVVGGPSGPMLLFRIAAT